MLPARCPAPLRIRFASCPDTPFPRTTRVFPESGTVDYLLPAGPVPTTRRSALRATPSGASGSRTTRLDQPTSSSTCRGPSSKGSYSSPARPEPWASRPKAGYVVVGSGKGIRGDRGAAQRFLSQRLPPRFLRQSGIFWVKKDSWKVSRNVLKRAISKAVLYCKKARSA